MSSQSSQQSMNTIRGVKLQTAFRAYAAVLNVEALLQFSIFSLTVSKQTISDENHTCKYSRLSAKLKMSASVYADCKLRGAPTGNAMATAVTTMRRPCGCRLACYIATRAHGNLCDKLCVPSIAWLSCAGCSAICAKCTVRLQSSRE